MTRWPRRALPMAGAAASPKFSSRAGGSSSSTAWRPIDEERWADMAEPAADKKAGGGLSVIGLILLSLIAVGSGAGFGMILPGLMEKEKKPVAEPSKAAQAHGPGAQLVPLTPITTNLAHPSATWVRLESMLVAREEMGPDGSVLVKRMSEV